jgi:hypothetical protein
MLLFINSDKNKATGWEGYDYVINHQLQSSSQTTVKKWNGTSWVNVGAGSYAVSVNEMEISIKRTLLGMDGAPPSFYFHWADNPKNLNDISSFFVDGDSAPDRRFDYQYNAPPATKALLNIDNSDQTTQYDAATDGVLLTRYLLGFRDSALVAGARGTGSQLRDATQIASYIDSNRAAFDVDGDGVTLATTDAVMIVRRLLGLSGSPLTAHANRGTRSDAQVEAAIEGLRQ